jgi:hypothetical protein
MRRGITFIKETREVADQVQYRGCISKFVWLAMKSSGTLVQIVLQALRLVPYITKDFDESWDTIETVDVNFPRKDTVNGTMHGAQTFGPWQKKLDPDKYPQAEVFPATVDKNDIEMRIVLSMGVDDDLYIDGKLDDPLVGEGNGIYKEIDPWDENRTITLDIENNYGEDPDAEHPHGGGGTIQVQTRVKPGTCTYVNRARVRDFKYEMAQDIIPGGGPLGVGVFSCLTMQSQRCEVKPRQRTDFPLRTEVTYPPPKGRTFPPCPNYVSTISRTEPPMIGKTELSPGGFGQWQYRGASSCNTRINFEWMPDVDVVPVGYADATCKALFKAKYLFEIFTYVNQDENLDPAIWYYVQFPFYGGGYMSGVDTFLEKYLWKYFNAKVDIETRYYDRVTNSRYRCVCPDLETSPCLDPATKRAIERVLYAGECLAAGAIATAAISILGATPPGAVCLGAGAALIFLTANPHNGDEGKPPRRPD